ncbi:aminotransferase class I/II-fold pyridoxal phosphate-dependent enzyme [Cohnella algarum]|uniref:aminotransferase class I/II-fold pyridoxal phosphate-dependent enzyme n=1 Tax=Cohnella algarum TaxID=2044859 RepID=UPI00196728F6|nr:aminotransferase class I/II-fold pyridoxal phosphate-dependent enzyme [Cohnella algarum]MBN2979854.1 aminotransferase class I/II-fold pyridoxal phosphate-dependent enzyme [Cohnella algarum]
MNRIINWMGGWPKEGLIGAGEWEERTGKFAATGRQETLGTEPVQGHFGLREQVAERIAGSAAERDPSRVWIAAGADAAIELAVRGWLRAEDVVLVERPCGRSALQIFQRAGAVAVAVPGDRDGMDPDALARAIRQWKPKLVYAAVACTDPEGRAWSAERRIALAERCREANVPLLRDDRQLLLAQDGLAPDAEAEAGAPLCSVGEWPRASWRTCASAGWRAGESGRSGCRRSPPEAGAFRRCRRRNSKRRRNCCRPERSSRWSRRKGSFARRESGCCWSN